MQLKVAEDEKMSDDEEVSSSFIEEQTAVNTEGLFRKFKENEPGVGEQVEEEKSLFEDIEVEEEERRERREVDTEQMLESPDESLELDVTEESCSSSARLVTLTHPQVLSGFGLVQADHFKLWPSVTSRASDSISCPNKKTQCVQKITAAPSGAGVFSEGFIGPLAIAKASTTI